MFTIFVYFFYAFRIVLLSFSWKCKKTRINFLLTCPALAANMIHDGLKFLVISGQNQISFWLKLPPSPWLAHLCSWPGPINTSLIYLAICADFWQQELGINQATHSHSYGLLDGRDGITPYCPLTTTPTTGPPPSILSRIPTPTPPFFGQNHKHMLANYAHFLFQLFIKNKNKW